MTKNEKRVVIVDAIVLVMFLVIAFAVPFQKDIIFWISFAFGLFAIVVQLLTLKLAFSKGEDVRSKFYGFPIAKICLAYLVIQVVLSFIFMSLKSVVTVPTAIPVVAYVLLLGISAIGFIAADAAREEIVRQDGKLSTDTQCMKALRSAVGTLSDQCTDVNVKNELTKLAEAFQYSDPVSSDAVNGIEAKLKVQVEELQKAVACTDQASVLESCKQISATLVERNRVCKLNK